ncbi:uncharacterized protein FTOL_06589 [Fusarium torulosum]|uniref:Uncharacterized protein n=1 Tax=Fusarium torulosum TaxID=33205 RepID=A0AAE8MAB9_9HYPO|nr:uncharacterized protein FTOL_06589 [Fusarium torulosum]
MGILCCKPERPVTQDEIDEYRRYRRIYLKDRLPPEPHDSPDCYETRLYAAQDLEAYRRLPARPPSDSNYTPTSGKPPELEEISEEVEPDPEGTLVGIDVPSTATDTVTGFVAA